MYAVYAVVCRVQCGVCSVACAVWRVEFNVTQVTRQRAARLTCTSRTTIYEYTGINARQSVSPWKARYMNKDDAGAAVDDASTGVAGDVEGVDVEGTSSSAPNAAPNAAAAAAAFFRSAKELIRSMARLA